MVTFKELGKYGRMGNCLFQLSSVIGYAKKYNLDFCFPSWEYSKHINLDQKYFGHKLQIKNTYNEPVFHYTEIPNGYDNLHGYFQSPKYFEHCKNYIKNALSPIEPEPDMDICSIHVRRTDYLKHKDCYNILDMDYYERAMDMIPCNNFVVFSDDIKWCKEHFSGSRVIVSDAAPDYTDFKMMQACKGGSIIANSSFSWWAAWLSGNETVIAPKKWFGPALQHNTKDLISEGWVTI